MTEIAVYKQPAIAKAVGNDYEVSLGTGACVGLVRDVDFGVIPGTKKPCLYKSGAERLLFAMGIESEYTVESAIEEWNGEEPFFFYRVRCSCYKTIDGVRIHITDGMGSANSNEKQCGRAAKWDVANARLKIAKKRAMVDAVLLLGQLSNAFAQDIENEEFMQQSTKVTTNLDPTDPITAKQRSRIYALAGQAGVSQAQAKKIMSDAGFQSTTVITQADYDRVCALFTKEDMK